MAYDQNKAQRRSEKVEKSLKEAPLPPLPFAGNIQAIGSLAGEKELERIAHKEGTLTVEEASKLVVNLDKKGEEIRKKLDEMYAQRGVSPAYLKLYMSNPNNFTPEEWKNLQSQRQALVDSMNLPAESEEMKKAASRFLGTTDLSNNPDTAKGRRVKTAGARHRHWLPMR